MSLTHSYTLKLDCGKGYSGQTCYNSLSSEIDSFLSSRDVRIHLTMKNIEKKLTVVVSSIVLLSSGAMRTGSAAELQPLAANTPQQFNECEHTVSDPIRGHWTRTQYGFVAEWENGAKATLQFTSNDASGVALERRDGTGSTAGITATYAGKMVSPNEFAGTVTWMNQGKPSNGEWSITCDPREWDGVRIILRGRHLRYMDPLRS